MKLIKIINKEKYNSFIAGQKHAQFLQSWEWGEFYEDLGFRVERLGLYKNNELIFAFTLIEKKVGFVRYYYSPRIEIKFLEPEDLSFLFQEIKKIAKKEKIIFWRFEPKSKLKIKNCKLKIERTLDVQPSKTLILDISEPEEEILKSFKQKTRYNIRLAEKRGVATSLQSSPLKGEGGYSFEDWWQVMEETKNRDGFRLHSKDYYKSMIKDLGEGAQGEGVNNFKIKLILAKYNNEIIAGNIIAFFGDLAVYVHGASSNKYRNVMAPYALQWQAIKTAKNFGCKYYDFNGIDENKWPGVTRFKLGFGGEEIDYPGTLDAVFSKRWYYVYKIARKLRRII